MYREEVLALVPAEDRERFSAIPWSGYTVPEPIILRISEAALHERFTKASATYTELAQEVLGSPFRKSMPVIDPTWLTWNSGTVRHIAEHIFTTRSFCDMPILADALEDAGCADEELLRHCREGQTHVPGCWALDVLLGRG
jgi:hypothetical protein